MILCENVSKNFNNISLKNINLVIEQGKCTAIVGSESSGKNELVNLILGITSADAGRIWLGGKNPDFLCKTPVRMTLYERSKISFGSGYDKYPKLTLNHWLDKPNKNSESYSVFLEKYLKKLNIKGLLNTTISFLSAGEFKKAEFIKKLYQNPDILILDQPFTAVDASVKEIMTMAIKEFCQDFNRTVIIVCSKISTAENTCDKLYLMSKGEIVFSGTVEDFKKSFDFNRESQVKFNLKDKYPDFGEIPVKTIEYDTDDKILTVSFDPDNVNSINVINQVLKTSDSNEITVKEISIDEILAKRS